MSSIEHILDSSQREVRIAFISNYIPTKCGIATFTKDLCKATNDLNPHALASIVALSDDGSEPFPSEVGFVINRYKKSDYLRAAEWLNNGPFEVVSLQHEYGLYGGEAGEYIFELVKHLKKPLITTLHTILSKPSPAQLQVITQLSQYSVNLVAMLPDAKERLEQIYGVDPGKVVLIHHGVPDQPKANKLNKVTFGWQDRRVLMVGGLIGPDKGIEYILEALPKVVAQFPETIFVIVGQTHPNIITKNGEVYREQLLKQVSELQLEQHVEFVNRYLPLNELLTYYEACDIYLTTHLNPEQVTSGTLAYALGMGKACISTPYIYADEMLANGRGSLVPFRNSQAISEAILDLFSQSAKMREMERKAYALGRTMSWPRVAERYLILFRLVEQHIHAPTPTT